MKVLFKSTLFCTGVQTSEQRILETRGCVMGVPVMLDVVVIRPPRRILTTVPTAPGVNERRYFYVKQARNEECALDIELER